VEKEDEREGWKLSLNACKDGKKLLPPKNVVFVPIVLLGIKYCLRSAGE
jgi:hypothetical protein